MDNFRHSWAPARAGLAIGVLGLLILPLAPTAWAADPGRAPALCTFDVHDSVSPGWLMTPSQGTAYGIGTMTCVGALEGKQIAGGPGHFEWWYSYGSSDVPVGGNTCALAAGSGTWEVRLPTVDGLAMVLTGPWSFTGNSVGEIHGQLGGLPVEMVWEGYADPDHPGQDCVTKRASEFRVIGQGTVG